MLGTKYLEAREIPMYLNREHILLAIIFLQE